MAVKLKIGSGEEPKKPTKVKVNKTGTTPTPAEIEAANKIARDISVRRGLMQGENLNVGNQIPKFYDERTGKELLPGDAQPPVGTLSNKVPLYVKSLEWDSKSNLPYYIDEKTGDTQYVAKDLFYSPRFKKAAPISTAITALAKR